MNFTTLSRLAALWTAATTLVMSSPARAVDIYWDGGAGTTDWFNGTNWAPNNIPEWRFSDRAFLGSTQSGALASATVDYTTTPAAFTNTAAGLVMGRDPGTTGTLNISGGLMTHSFRATALARNGAVYLGVNDNGTTYAQGGRGFLTMTGGGLNATGLFIEGEAVEGVASTVHLSGNASVTLGPNLAPPPNTNADTTPDGIGADNVVLGRNLTIVGPNVNFTNTGNIRFLANSSFNAQITSATTHSPLKTTGNVSRAGTLNVGFSGLASNPTVGETWHLIDYGGSLSTTNFSNVPASRVVTVSGLPQAVPLGAEFKLQTATGGVNGKLLQLKLDQLLVLEVDRDDGQMRITNPWAGAIGIDSYAIRSATGGLLASYSGIGVVTPGTNTWTRSVNNDANTLIEIKDPDFSVPISGDDVYDLTSVPSRSIGSGFNQRAVANDIANFGTDGEDLTFEYSFPDGEIVRGHVKYLDGAGAKFENNLKLRVNPTNGNAYIMNDSEVTLKFDGFNILSSTGAITSGAFAGLGGSWATTLPITPNAIVQTNLEGLTELDPGDELPIGRISTTANAFTSAAAQAGLSFEFILAETLPGTSGGSVLGDYNSNGSVDAADYTIWRNAANTAGTLPNQNPAATTPNLIDQEDYLFWKQNFGNVSGPQPEQTFRTGSISFDAPASGSGSVAFVPEPAAATLLLIGLGCLFASRSHRRVAQDHTIHGFEKNEQPSALAGANTMLKQFNGAAALLSAVAVLAVAQSALAVTQGISVINRDFNLPATRTWFHNTSGVPVVEGSTDPQAPDIPGWTAANNGVTVRDPDGTGPLTPVPIGDSSVESGGSSLLPSVAGNRMTLSMLDGVIYQVTNFPIVSIPATQVYQLSFDAQDAFTADANNSAFDNRAQFTVRLTYGDSRTPLGSPLVVSGLSANPLTTDWKNFRLNIPSSLITGPVVGQPIGIEFDNTTDVFNSGTEFAVTQGFISFDNVWLQITGAIDGDLNGNGVVDAVDYSLVSNAQQTAKTYKSEGEMNGDGVVNLTDFRIFKNFYQAENGSGGSAEIVGGVPEPSSLALLSIVVSAIAAIVRRRPSRRCSALLASGVAGVIVCCASSASGELLFYDPFNGPPYNAAMLDPTGATGDGQAPNVGDFFIDEWRLQNAGTAQNTHFVPTAGLNYKNAGASGGAAQAIFNTTTSDAPSQVGRYLATPWDDTKTGTFYVGFQVDFGSVPEANRNSTQAADMGFRAVEFWPVGGAGVGDETGGGGRFEIGFQAFGTPAATSLPSTARLRYNDYQLGSTTLTDTVFNDFAGPHLIVMKFELSDVTGSDVITIYLDPATPNEPGEGEETARLPNRNFTWQAMGAASYFGTGIGVLPIFDELRIATTFAEAIPPNLPRPGDVNNDTFVDMTDYQIIMANMGLFTSVGDVGGANGKPGSDGRVDIRDFRVWKDNRTDVPGVGGGAGSLVGVPEPGSLLLAILGVALAFPFRRPRR